MSKKQWRSRTITFANSAVRIKYAGSQEEALINFLYQDLPNNTASPPHTQFSLSIDEHGYFQLFHGESLLNISQQEAIIAEHLLGMTCHHLADKSHGGLLFHAATVGWQGHGILLPGASGAGKSTLTAWLLNQGFIYLTDELSFIESDSLVLHAFTRPLNLKQSSWTIVEPLLTDVQSEQIMRGPRTYLIPSGFFNRQEARSIIQPRLIIFPRYQNDGSFEWRRLSAAQAGLALMQCLINARNLPVHGFTQVTQLAKNVPAYVLQYTNFKQLGEIFEKLEQVLTHPT